jgi:hypothetical protein
MVDCHDSPVNGANCTCVDYWSPTFGGIHKHEPYLLVNIAKRGRQRLCADDEYRAAYDGDLAMRAPASTSADPRWDQLRAEIQRHPAQRAVLSGRSRPNLKFSSTSGGEPWRVGGVTQQVIDEIGVVAMDCR